MAAVSTVELRDWLIQADIGTYGPNDTVPDAHLLDLTLWIRPERVLIPQDGMAHVYDYDPLIAGIEQLAADGHYETQERLITRMVALCARDEAVEALEVALRKTPVRRGSGSLGVRIHLDGEALQRWRAEQP